MAWAAIDPDESGNGPWLAVGCMRSEYHMCEQVPGMNHSKADQIWRAPLSWPAWVALQTVWAGQPLEIRGTLRFWADRQWDHVQQAYRLRSALDCEHSGGRALLEKLDRDSGRELFPFQRGGAWWLVAMRRAVLEDPQGNGKTPQLIRAMQAARTENPRPFLVIATASALYNWEREIRNWAPELTVRVIDGTVEKRRKRLMDEAEADVYVMGWSVVRLHTRLAAYPGKAFVRCDEHGGSTGKTAGQCEVHDKELNAIAWQGIIADEAHRMKDATSKQTRAVWHLAHGADYFWPATGTPVGDTIADIWPLLHAIDSRAFPSKSRYLDLYAVKMMAWARGADYLDIRPETARAYHATVQPLVRRIPKEVARPQMPPRLPVVFRNPEMSAAQKRLYAQLKKEALAELESSTVTTPNDVVKFSRMCQLASSMIETWDDEDKDGFTVQRVKMIAPSHKADDMLDFLDDNPGPLVVAMNSPQLLAICEAKLAARKITSCSIHGGKTASQRDQAVQWFQEGECRVMLLTSAGSESITLTASDTILFLQPNPSYLATEQLIGRVDRIGQRSPVRVVYSITSGSVEERLYELSRDKAARAENVTRDADLLRWIISGNGDGPSHRDSTPAPSDDASHPVGD